MTLDSEYLSWLRPPVVSQSVDTHRDQIRDQLPPVLDQLSDSLSGLKDTMTTLTTGNTARESQTRNAGKRLSMSGGKFDTSKITQFNGLCELGPLDEYWLRPDVWTRKFSRELLVCYIPLNFWTQYELLCCGDIVTKLWETEFETPVNPEPGWRPTLLLKIQDDGGEVPYTHRRDWSFFVCWLCKKFKNPGLYQIQRMVFEDFTKQCWGESVYQYNHRWNLDKEFLDELASANMYTSGTYSWLFEVIIIRSLLLPLGNKLRDLKSVGTTLLKILPNLHCAQDPDYEE